LHGVPAEALPPDRLDSRRAIAADNGNQTRNLATIDMRGHGIVQHLQPGTTEFLLWHASSCLLAFLRPAIL
jgi:hypothetical protein